ncbi:MULTISPECIES: hypothetical protein [Rhizobium]|nr:MULTISPECIES: hypothetical protein [Rhizobium]MBM7048333.1 hypothetical protein [Rhizobium lusitanum]
MTVVHDQMTLNLGTAKTAVVFGLWVRQFATPARNVPETLMRGRKA